MYFEPPDPDPGDETATGDATVETTEAGVVNGTYQAKVSVTYNTETGEIVSVEDNGTEPGTYNQSFWNDAKAMFAKLIGKTKNNVDAVDAVTGATVSSNAIKEAVLDALPD